MAQVEEPTLAVVVVRVGIKLQLVLVSLAGHPTPLLLEQEEPQGSQVVQRFKVELVAIPSFLLLLLLVVAVVATLLLVVLLTALLVVLEVVVVL